MRVGKGGDLQGGHGDNSLGTAAMRVAVQAAWAVRVAVWAMPAAVRAVWVAVQAVWAAVRAAVRSAVW